jgi:hypothetical protein
MNALKQLRRLIGMHMATIALGWYMKFEDFDAMSDETLEAFEKFSRLLVADAERATRKRPAG